MATDNEIDFSGLDPFTTTALRRWRDAKEFSAKWRQEARDDYAFVSGQQWEEEDAQLLREQKRPPITFNYSEKMIDAVAGAEVQNRQEVRYLPREVDDSALSEIWSAAGKWARDQCNAEDEETDAFRDMLICGMGWTETRMDYEVDANGSILIERRDPVEMYYDPAAKKPALSDARYVFHAAWIDNEEIKRTWPDALILSTDMTSRTGGGVINQAHRYEGEPHDEDIHKDQTNILHYQCYELEPYYRVKDPQSGAIIEIEQAKFTKLKPRFDEFGVSYVKQMKRVYYRAFFAGETLLEKGLSPCQEGFTLRCMTGKRDRNHNTWYGLTRVMKDPQRWANKWLSQILHIINTNAKGGLLAEIGAFVDPRKAQDEWAKPDSVTLLSEGAMNKVQQKQQAPYPQGLDRLMDFALNSLPMVTGINLEALGLANREQAGVLEAQRKQAAYGLLAPMFDALRRYRKEQGRILLYFIREFISDGRLIRITGPDGERVVQLTKDPQAVTYDIIIDQSPNSPDSKTKTWEALVQLLPSLLKAGVPIPPDLFDYTPLPTTLAQRWKEYTKAQVASPDQVRQMQQQMRQMSAENEQLKRDQSEAMAKLQMQRDETQAELELKARAQEQEFDLKRAQMENDLRLEKQKMLEELSNNRAKLVGDIKLKAAQAGFDISGDELALKLDTSDLNQALEQLAKSQQTITDVLAQTLTLLADALTRPKVVIRDNAGRPIGIKMAEQSNLH